MTLPRTMAAAGSQAQPRRTLWRIDMIETVKLAWPIALTQLGQIAMMTTDLALIGRLGEHAIAAVGLAHLVLFVGFVLGMGPVSAVAPLAAQAFGARKPRLVRRSLRVGLWAAAIIGIPVNVAQLWGEELLIAAGQSSETAALAARYLAGLTWSMIPAWCFIAFRNFMGAVNRPEPALAITLAAIPANGLLAYALIHGTFGLPRLDLLGAGLATTFVNAAMCAAAIWVCYTRRPFKKYRVLGRFWRADWELMRKLLVIGLPISGGFLLEWGLFSSAALLVGWIGTTALAGNMRLDRSLTPASRRILQTSVDHAYAEFLRRVGDGRKKSVEDVDKIAQGRVWAGIDAQRIGLVDHLGGLKDATDAAAKLAELGSDYNVDYIEPELSLRQELLMQLRSETLRMGQIAGIIAPRSDMERVLDPVLEQARAIARLNDPRGLYAYCWCREPRMTLRGLAGR